MIKDIVTYPTPPSVEYATDVRVFDNTLFSLIEDLKDTIKQNNLNGLAAYQIGCYFNIIVVKDDAGNFLELINPRLISQNGTITTEETTAYFKNLKANVQRYKNISIVYQTRDGNNKSLKASGKFSVLLQRKIDYTFGSTFINKLSENEKKRFEKKLEHGIEIATPESCPIVSYKDYINKFNNILVAIVTLLFISTLFISTETTLIKIWYYQKILSLTTILGGITYFIYGYFEGKKYLACTSCQIGNMIGTLSIIFIKLTIIMILSYLFIL
jgi:peptide deformylase